MSPSPSYGDIFAERLTSVIIVEHRQTLTAGLRRFSLWDRISAMAPAQLGAVERRLISDRGSWGDRSYHAGCQTTVFKAL